ncbi:MAG: alpha/beta fold hydrolase [Patescibacteria group bacterium]|nr:alpha/beta fold hydrolase [Patescibacteria group bacterium]
MTHVQKPIILREGHNSLIDLATLRTAHHIWKERDIYVLQLGELFEVIHPHILYAPEFAILKEKFIEERCRRQEEVLRGNWVYYPWSGVLLHTVSEEEHFTLITNRNRDIITKEEQAQLRNFRVGIVGLSVGSNIASALAYGGIASTMRLAEFDSLETTNLNRIRARIDQVGVSKAAVVAQQLYEANPYMQIECFTEGLTKESISRFMRGDPKPQLIFEIMDSFEMKIHLRILAKKERIPVIMVTNLGDRLLMDIERYDLNPDTEFFNGRAGSIPADLLKNPDITIHDKHRYAVLLAGGEKNVPERVLASVRTIGTRLVGRPQLGSTVTVSGGIGAYFTRKIALHEELSGGSWLVDFDEVFNVESKFSISKPSPMDSEKRLVAFIDSEITLHTVDVLGHRLRYAKYGSGTPIILLHGGTFGWGAWYANIKELGIHHTVYALDLPGAGNSSSLDYKTMDFQNDFVNVVTAFLRALECECSVVGHSFGAWIAVHVARKIPVRSMVLVDPVGFSTHATFSDLMIAQYSIAKIISKTALRTNNNDIGLEGLLRSAFRNRETVLPDAFLKYFNDTMKRHHNLLFISRLVAQRKKLFFNDDKIVFSCPTRILWGVHDPITPIAHSQDSLKKIYNARIELFPQSGHVPQIEQSEEFNNSVIEFLNKC